MASQRGEYEVVHGVAHPALQPRPRESLPEQQMPFFSEPVHSEYATFISQPAHMGYDTSMTTRSRSTSPSPPEPKRYRRDTETRPRLGAFLRQWWKEIAAVLTSIAFLVAVILVLLRINNTSLARWSAPWNIKPTTLIAALITLCKLFLLVAVGEAISQLKWVYFEKKAHKLEDIEVFDGASRGVFGAVSFLFAVRWRAVAGSLGALIVILALAMEPFAQQTLSFYNKGVPDEVSAASIPHASNYDLNTAYEASPYSGQMNHMARKLYVPMLSSMLQGLYNPSNTVKFDCGTTNCTWSNFKTLGICSTCADISTSLKSKCSYKRNQTAMSEVVCQYETPSGAEMEASCYQNAGGSQSTLWNSSTSLTEAPNIIKIAGISFSAEDPALANCAFDPSFRMPKPTATECTLSWCMKEVQSEVKKGTLTEKVISETNLIFPKDTCNESFFQPQTTDGDRWALNRFPYVDFSEKPPPEVYVYAAFLPDDVPRNICADWRSQPNSAFWINVQDSSNIGSLLTTIFTAPYTTAYAGDTIFGELFYSVNHGDFTTDIKEMVNSMTNYIRQGPNSSTITGTPLLTETYIRVNWQWLAYPCGLVLFALLFLLAAIIASARKSRIVWKSSSLALLFHGLQTWPASNERSPLRNQSDMKKVAKDVYVKLEENEVNHLHLIAK